MVEGSDEEGIRLLSHGFHLDELTQVLLFLSDLNDPPYIWIGSFCIC